MDTKRRILEISKQLFNEKGYQNVRMRDISSRLGISVGNLTYHFKKKEDILKALMAEAAPLEAYPENVSLTSLNQFLYELIQSIQEHLFFFTCDDLFRLNPEFEQANRIKVESLIVKFTKILHELKKNGYFTDALTDKTIEALVEMMMMAHLSWARKVNICGFEVFPVAKFIAYHWHIFEPFLTAKAAEEYAGIKKDFNA